MCVIIWAPSGNIPRGDVLAAMARHPDGWGFTVVARRRLLTYRSVEPKRFFDSWHGRAKGPVLFHARWATHGKVCVANCHPFKVAGHELVVAHNGMLAGFGSERHSDTRAFISEVIEPLPEWFTEEAGICRALEAAIGGSKMVLLNSAGVATILNERLGTWHDGRWYSNTTLFQLTED